MPAANITIATPPENQDLTTIIRVKEELGLTGSTHDTLLTRLVSEASAKVYTFLGRPLYRAQYVELRRGNDDKVLDLARYPLASIESISYSDVAQTLTDFSVVDPRIGRITRTTASGTGALRFSDSGSPIAWSFTYTAGYFLVGDDYAGTVSVDSADSSYNAAAADFHPLLRPGDWINWAGFANAANNGLHKVVTAAAGKIAVAETLTTETPAVSVTATLENVESVFSRAAISLVRSTFLARQRDGGLKRLTVGPITYEWDRGAVSSMQSDLAPYRVN